MPTERIELPAPDRQSGTSLAAALASRRSLRAFAPRPLTRAELGQLLWSAQGVTEPRERLRACPSAGALYPLIIYAALEQGLYRYVVEAHALERVAAEDLRRALASAALEQREIAQAPCVLVVTAVAARSTRKYGERAIRYVHMEAGHAAQNVLLTATALGLAACPVGAFDDDRVARCLQIGRGEAPLYIVPVGAQSAP